MYEGTKHRGQIIKKYKALTELKIDGNEISDKGLRMLVNALSNCISLGTSY
jgi:hypothetical protein